MDSNNTQTNERHVVVLGGGNGTSRLLRSLLPLFKEGKLASLHALVHMADDGGSTGRLREQYGVAGAGDLTNCILALSGLQGDLRGDEFLKSLHYRFSEGEVAGHTLRNLFLTALQKTSDLDSALATMARILQVPKFTGAIPTTLIPLTQQVEITVDGTTNVLGEGEHSIAHKVNLQADPRWPAGSAKVTFVEKNVPLNPRATELLEAATDIIVAPGHTYGTILPTLALPALGEAIKNSDAPISVVMTLLTTPRQTTGWSGEDFIDAYQHYLGRKPKNVISNSTIAEAPLVHGQEWVHFEKTDHDYNLIKSDIVNTLLPARQHGDVISRAIVVHDTEKLLKIFTELLTEGRKS